MDSEELIYKINDGKNGTFDSVFKRNELSDLIGKTGKFIYINILSYLELNCI